MFKTKSIQSPKLNDLIHFILSLNENLFFCIWQSEIINTLYCHCYLGQFSQGPSPLYLSLWLPGLNPQDTM